MFTVHLDHHHDLRLRTCDWKCDFQMILYVRTLNAAIDKAVRARGTKAISQLEVGDDRI